MLPYQLPADSNSHMKKPLILVTCPCRMYNESLPISDLHVLSFALCPKDASYWFDYYYSVYPFTHEFFYTFNLQTDTLGDLGALGNHVQTIERFSK